MDGYDTAASRARRSRRVHIDDRSVCQGVRPTTDELMNGRPAGRRPFLSFCLPHMDDDALMPVLMACSASDASLVSISQNDDEPAISDPLTTRPCVLWSFTFDC